MAKRKNTKGQTTIYKTYTYYNRLKARVQGFGNGFPNSVPKELGCQKNYLPLLYSVCNFQDYSLSQVGGKEVDIDNFLTDTFENWSEKMKGDGEFADHIVVQTTATMLTTDILIVTSSPESNPENCIRYIKGEDNFIFIIKLFSSDLKIILIFYIYLSTKSTFLTGNTTPRSTS
jgi:hypothetical protein